MPGRSTCVMTDQPVRLLQVGPDLAEKHVRRDADRAGEAFADLVAQGPLHLQGQCPRATGICRSVPIRRAGHLVDRADLLDRQAGVDRLQDALVILAVEPVIGLYRDNGRAQLPRLAHQGAGLDAERLGRVAGGDRHGGIRRRLHDDNRLPAQGRVLLLLARRKEGVKVEEQPLHRVFGR